MKLRLSPALWNLLPPGFQRLFVYGLYTAFGLSLDICIFLLFTHGAHVQPFWGNIAGGAVASTFVYYVTVRRIFNYQGQFLVTKWLAYVGYICVALLVASALVQLIISIWLVMPIVAKLILVPIQFFLNYFVLGRILAAFEPKKAV
jgi:hypothetical protein